ncbi:MAG TPA: glutamate ABC transporter substrate-binding protein [Pseudonocardia sp.]|jgi:polar amino acid transport system substrate-binding protein|nr:glutamate ABC transporter substrate-binding protein [Pseudonocardia sp.]
MTAPHRTGGVNVARPLVYLGVAAAIGLGSLLLPSTGAAPTPPAPAATAPTNAPGPACSEVKESLRPEGPLPPPGALPAGSTMAKIAARGRLIAGVDQGKYLVGYRNPITGQLEGSDIDIVRRIATAIFGDPNRVQFVVLDIADRQGSLDRGQVDLVVNSFSVTCDRQRTVEFSTAYMAATARVLVPVNSGVREVEDLAGKRVCTSAGSTTERMLRALPARLDVYTLPGIPDCMVDLQHGKAASVSSDDVLLAGLAAQDPQTHVVGRSLLLSDYAVGMRRDTPDLVRFVNGVLEEARADGSLAASDQRWLGRLNPVPRPAPARYRD